MWVPGWDLFYWSFISGLTKMGPWVAGQTSGPRAERSMTPETLPNGKEGSAGQPLEAKAVSAWWTELGSG